MSENANSVSSTEAACLTVYATFINEGRIRWRNGRWEFAGPGLSIRDHEDIQRACNEAAAFLRRLGVEVGK